MEHYSVETATGSGTAVVIIIMEPYIVLVKDKAKPEPHWWKWPGGQIELNETPLQAAVRESEEETGLKIDPAKTNLLHVEDRSNHSVYVYGTKVENLDGLRKVGDEGEDVQAFFLDDLAALSTECKFHPDYLKLIEELRKKLQKEYDEKHAATE